MFKKSGSPPALKKKILLACSLIIFSSLTVFGNETNYKLNSQNTIIDLNLNGKLDYEFEIYVNSDGAFSLPFKATTKLLDIPSNQNSETKTITFIAPSGTSGTIDYQNQKITYGNKVITFQKDSLTKLVYLKQGIMPETSDEIFVPLIFLNEILESNIQPDNANFSISISTDRILKVILEYDDQHQALNPFDLPKTKDTTPETIIQPEAKGILSFDNISINNQTRMDSIQSSSSSYNYQNNTMNNLSQIKLLGTLAGGDYEIRTDLLKYEKPVDWNGIGAKYKKHFGSKTLEIGEINEVKTNELSVGSEVWGVGFGTLNNNEENYHNLSGQVAPGSKINVYINDKFLAQINTMGGYYNLRDLPYNDNKVSKIKLEEVTSNNEIKIIKEKKYAVSSDILAEGETKYRIFSGVTGYNKRFFSDNNYFNQSQAKKLVIGSQVSHGISDKLTVNFLGLNDNILSKAHQNQRLNDSFLLIGGYKNTNNLSGQTGIVSLNYKPTEDVTLKSDLGLSNSNEGLGFVSTIETNYKKKQYNLSAKLFDYSQEFYLAGSSGFSNNLSGRKGGELSGNLDLKSWKLSGSTSKYSSDLFGISSSNINFNETNFSAYKSFKNDSNLSLIYGNKKGDGIAGKINNDYLNINYNKKLANSLNFSLIEKIDHFNNDIYSQDVQSISSSDFKLLSARLDYDLNKNLGKLTFMHDIVKSEVNDSKNNYNALRLGYTFPVIKGFTPSASVGYHYLGINNGLDASASLGYQFKSGRRFEIAYSINRESGVQAGNMFIPTTSHSSLTFNLTDTLAFTGGGIKSIGSFNDQYGFIEAITFLDINQNGIKDKNEPAIDSIPLQTNENPVCVTNKKGVYCSQGLPEGIYKVNLAGDKLPSLLALSNASKDSYALRVEKGHKTKAYFGLISSVGSASGKVNIIDEFKRKINIDNIVVVVMDENGNEIKYTTIDENGNYYISGLSPGKYTITVDKDFIENYHLHKPSENKETTVTIPPVYKDFVDIKNVDLRYIQSYSAG